MDRVTFHSTPGPKYLHQALRAEFEEQARAVADPVTTADWSSVVLIARAVAERTGAGWDGGTLRYPVEDVLDAGEEPFEGVHVHSPLGDVLVGVAAFERLMARYLRAVLSAGASAKAGDEPWWTEVRSSLMRIEARLRDEGVLD
jgi:hypothetical protein